MAAEHVVVASTTDSEEAALALASGVVAARLAACAQVIGPMTSVFHWDGGVQTEREWRVECKTAADRVDELTEHLRAEHSYDVPEIIVTPVTGGSADYLAWVVEQTRT